MFISVFSLDDLSPLDIDSFFVRNVKALILTSRD